MAGIFGVNVNDDCIQKTSTFYKRNSQLGWIIFKLDGDKTLLVDSCKTKDETFSFENTFDDFVDHLPKDDVRYALYNYEYESPTDKINRCKTIFIMWAPEQASIKRKMLTTMYLRDISNQLTRNRGFPVTLQANDLEDLHYRGVFQKIRTKFYCM